MTVFDHQALAHRFAAAMNAGDKALFKALVTVDFVTEWPQSGGGNTGTITLKAKYPDGSDWWVVSLYHLRDGRIAQTTSFFAPVYPAPEWRRQWVERLG